MTSARSLYVNGDIRCRSAYNKEKANAFIKTRHSDTNSFWRLLMSSVPHPQTNLTLTDFYNHFERVSNTEVLDPDADEHVNNCLNDYDNGMSNELNEPTEDDEFKNAIKELKSVKAAGEDMLITEFYMHMDVNYCLAN